MILQTIIKRPVVFFLIISIHKRTLAIFLFAVLVFCMLPLMPESTPVDAVSRAPSVNWGLSFQMPGKTPIIDVSPELLKKYDAYFVGDESQKELYLTFDAGFENGNTPAILDALKKHNAPAAFFLVGNFLDTQPELVKRMVAEGHIVGNHTANHPDMSKISSPEKFGAELSSLEEKYKEVTGQEMKKFYRPPEGRFSEDNLRMARELGYKTVFWSLAYVDWQTDKQPSREKAIKTLTDRLHPGAVVLLHSTSSTNAEILDELLTKWEELGYTFKSIEELGKAEESAQ